ncbi:sugar phosphate nucleotidyltransferase, partial [bacterium]|nr:sugar phosphate nucleotidyltransferase [bacterium]
QEPFLLMLGDHLYASKSEKSCAQQLMDVYDRVRQNVVGLKVTPVEQLHQFGCATGMWKEADSILSVTEFSEKPSIEYAREHLHVDGMKEDFYLTVFGQYILSHHIFDILEEHIKYNIREGGEFQLTSCLDKLRQEEGCTGVIIDGLRFDIGVPEAYRQTVIDYQNVS